jgi:O-acetyl-ADP-ribose deacetylase (regulator of RNase III)
MPTVKTVEGNLIRMFKERRFSAIAHGCNCYHTMGAGIAKQIAVEFPEAYQADLKTRVGRHKMGLRSEVLTEYGRIFNLYTQHRPGIEKPEILMGAIRRSFEDINEEFGGDVSYLLGIPKIGCGIAGGDWKYISRIIDEATPDLNICLVEYKP